jgi:hypothetical protein
LNSQAPSNNEALTMTASAQSKLVRKNTVLWLAAILLPVILHFGLGSTKFPWPIILPLLLVGPMIASNNLIKASGASKTARLESRTFDHGISDR